ncbi:MAG: hypothetical protein Marn2KO_17590 [Marinobacter nauticus]
MRMLDLLFALCELDDGGTHGFLPLTAWSDRRWQSVIVVGQNLCDLRLRLLLEYIL